MLQLRCPNCDAPIETHAADSRGAVRCARCDHLFAPDGGPAVHLDAHGSADGDGWTVHTPAFPGRRVFSFARRLARSPAYLVRIGRRHDARGQSRAKSGRVVKPRHFRWLSRSERRTIGIAIVVFVGIPAAVIFFLLVVCAPRGH